LFGIPICFIGFDGSLDGQLIPDSERADEQKQVWQLHASENSQQRFETAKRILRLKLQLLKRKYIRPVLIVFGLAIAILYP
jgi:CRISPR/Cas system-associated endonuclease Cas1